ncbi:predicted protein [Brucella sp. 83/13]|nr:predicted protein [Brucella sp. 83/13]
MCGICICCSVDSRRHPLGRDASSHYGGFGFEDRPTRMKTRKPGEIAGLSLFQATSRAACVFGLMPII